MKINRCISCAKEIENYPCPYCGFDRTAYQQPEYALPCDTVLHGRYLIGKVLGQGGFGITYVGWDLALEIKVAIKEYYPNGQVTRSASGTALNWYTNVQSKALQQNGMESFLKEARKMAKVEQIQEVVRVRDTFVENETAYIIMDFVEGQTLKSYLEKNGVLSWDEAQKIFFPVVSAMEQVHKAGIIHRDISPDNLMLLSNGGVKILDLGAAKDLTVNSGVSSMQVIKGGFSPIEQYSQSGSSGPWTDVYAMAATIYYTLTGTLPPAAVDRLDTDGLNWDLPQLKALPKNILQALQKAMVVSAQKRTQSMDELLKQVQEVPKQKTEKRKQPQKEKLAASEPKKKINFIRMGIIAAGIAAVGLAILIWPNGKVPDKQTRNPERLAEESTVCPPTVETTSDAEQIEPGVNIQWTLVDGILTISGSGEMEDYGERDNMAPWLEDDELRATIKKVVVEEGVTYIGTCSFYSLKRLKTVDIADSVTEIGDWAFTYCELLNNVKLPAELEQVGVAAFLMCTALPNITIPETVSRIKSNAFNYSDITNAVLSGNCKFSADSFPKYADVRQKNIDRNSGPCGANAVWTLSDTGLLTIAGTGEMQLFDDESDMAVAAPWYSRRGDIKAVSIENGITSIGHEAFYGCRNLTSVAIPDSVTEINRSAFEYCEALERISIPNSVTSLSTYVFSGCSVLKNIYLPSGLTEIQCGAFQTCFSLEQIQLPAQVSTIEERAFSWCRSLKSITLPKGVNRIEPYTFEYCYNLQSITIPESVSTIEVGAFWNCDSLKSITVSRECSMGVISVPDGTVIKYY